MTSEEKQTIVTAVLEALKTNSVRITDLTEVSNMPDSCYIEVSGGRKISGSSLIQALASEIVESAVTPAINTEKSQREAKDTELQGLITALQTLTNTKLASSAVVQTTGTGTTVVMSQNAVTILITALQSSVTSARNAAAAAQTTANTAVANAATAQAGVDALKGMMFGGVIVPTATVGTQAPPLVTCPTFFLTNGEGYIKYRKSDDTPIRITKKVPCVVLIKNKDAKTESGYQIAELHELYGFSNILTVISGHSQQFENVDSQFYPGITVPFVGITTSAGMTNRDDAFFTNPTGVMWLSDIKKFAYVDHSKTEYSLDWDDEDHVLPMSNYYDGGDTSKLYENKLYLYNGEVYLIKSGVMSKVGATTLINVTKEFPLASGYYTRATALAKIASNMRCYGLIITYQIAAGKWETSQYIGGALTDTEWAKTDNWSDFGGAAFGNVYNVTVQKPLTAGLFYSLIDEEYPNKSAAHVAFNEGKASLGIILSFAISKNTWKTYQYTGKEVDEDSFLNEDNWTDFGSLAAGSESYVDINHLLTNTTIYSLTSALDALKVHMQSTNTDYRKQGMIIAYKISENNEVECKQFKGATVNDFWQPGLWQDFGGGGKLEAKDDPDENGEDAFSTGGAYTHIPVQIDVNTETAGVVKMKLVNAAGDDVGDEVQFPVGTGTGGGSGTTIATAFQNNPLYGRAGGTFKIKAAIISTTKAGQIETTNSIMSVNFVNRTTKKVVATFQPKKASSSTMTDYSFEFDVSSLCTAAGELPLQAVIIDDGGNTATKNLSIIAVDVTCESVQTLNYTKDTTLEVGGQAKSIPVYRFPNNASDKGITAKIEMYKNGEWVTLATPTITDSYSHTVTIDPTGLAHGAHPIRIQGTDVSSGVTGNILHTSVMVIQQNESLGDYNTPIVVARWSDDSAGKKKLFETLQFDVAVFKRDSMRPTVSVIMEKTTPETIATQIMARNTTYTIKKRLTGVSQNDVLKFRAKCGTSVSPEDYQVTIDGTLLPISETEGIVFDIDMSERSNSDIDKTISVARADSGYATLTVKGSNYSSNGFVKDSYGTDSYGTANDAGRMSLRIAEDVTVSSNIKPYVNTAIETNGSALSFTTMVKNVANSSAELMSCKGDKMGFILTGDKLVVYTNGSSTDAATSCTVPYKTNMVHRFDIVVEPSAIAPYSGIGVIKVFKNGEEAGAVKYTAGAFPTTDATVNWNGTEADVYLYNVKFWNSYYNFIQAFNNYLIGLVDTDVMLSEYETNNVMTSQTCEGTTKERPSMQKCLDAGLCVVVLTKTASSDDIEKNYPDYLEGLDGDKKTTIQLDWYCYFPGREWQNCIITNTATSNQGTTSSWRKIKNKKSKFKKAEKITLMYTRQEISDMYGADPAILAKYDTAAAQAKKNKVQIKEGGRFTNIITMKVDYSDSTGAHNGSMMEQMNDMQLMLGDNYVTPAQKFNTDSTEIHTSIDSIPCALFRTDHRMTATEALDPANAYFHAKANFGADKGDADFFGFQKVPGYNSSCVNYGDFSELVAAPNQDFDEFVTATLATASTLQAGTLYMLSEYCGPKTAFIENDYTGHMTECAATESPKETTMTLAQALAASVKTFDRNTVYLTSDAHYIKYAGGEWKNTTGTMTFDNGTKKWSVTGRVLNPVYCFEYLKYDSLNWSQGVNGIDDMMATDATTGAPKWLSYYEARYPDNDNLNALFEEGKKVPYDLYQWLLFCQQCNQNLTASDGNITVNGAAVTGSKTNRTDKWRKELHKHANVFSILCYTTASDYHACVDQRSKNMMIAFYKETDGNSRAYLNHWYDGDCVDGSDNDCGLTIPWDMDARTSHLYQGWDNVIFQQTYAVDGSTDRQFWLDDTGTNKITLSQVADAMRKVQRHNVKTFSAEGCYYYWVTQRIAKWAKVISSFDGERKYIQNSTPSDNYFFALHGLRLDDLPDYQEKRFERCDGQFQVGDLYTNPFKARMMGTIKITITAAKEGFFGVGEDRADVCADSCHLNAGESYTFNIAQAQESGKMIYLFGANKISKLDISKCTPKLEAFSLEYCTLLEELVIGSTTYSPAYTTGILTQLNLPAMPFLKKLDIRRTKISSLSATNCPRLTEILAENSELTTVSLTESAPISVLHLPSTMTELTFSNLPNLTYPSGGLTFQGVSNVKRVRVTACPNINIHSLLNALHVGGASVSEISLPSVNVNGDIGPLQDLMTSGCKGVGTELTYGCDGLSGVWRMTTYVDVDTLAEIRAYFPELTIYNVQYTGISFDDTVSDPCNITNLDNNTGYGTGKDYEPSAHILNIWSQMHAVRAKYNSSTHKMSVKALSDTNYAKYADGSTFDPKDTIGEGYDVMLRTGHFWYKGVNDYKNQKKYIFFSSETTPVASGTYVRKSLSTLLYKEQVGVGIATLTVGSTFSEENLTTASTLNTYEVNVSGMAQIRFPGINNAIFGAVFVDKDNKVLSQFNMANASTLFDFQTGDYCFTSIPTGAVKFYFCCFNSVSATTEVITTDATNIEAIEPDWVEHKDNELIGVYGISIDNMSLPRSISGAKTKVGTGTSITNSNWTYDTSGRPNNATIPSSLNYTQKDFSNICAMRGLGYQLIDYDMNKIMSIMFWALTGNRNDQDVIGNGTSVGYTTGTRDSIGKSSTDKASGVNKLLGLEGFISCNFEWMDNIAFNVKSYADFIKQRSVESSQDPVDYKFHIYDPITKTERIVATPGSVSGNNIARVRNGRLCETTISAADSDTSKFITYYCAYASCNGSKGRVVGRAGYNGNVSGGLAYAYTVSASSNSSSSVGGRLAFRGEIVEEA